MPVRIKDVARYAGVSSATVSRVLADKPHVKETLRERVLDAVAALGYQPNRVARSLRVQRSLVLGIVISDIQNSFFTSVVRAVEDVAHQSGYAVFLCNSDEDPDKERLYIDLLLGEKVAGVVLTPTRDTAQAVRALLDAGIPVVSIDRRVSGLDIDSLDIDSVATDNACAAEALVGHLVAEGHRRIGAVLSQRGITTGRERFEGYCRALDAAGIALDMSLVLTGDPFEADGYRLTRELLERADPPGALFTGSKLLTTGALRAIYEGGLSVPDDVSVAAFDGLDWMPAMPAMTTAVQPTYAIGETAARLLLERIDRPERPVRHVVLKSDLRFRPHPDAPAGGAADSKAGTAGRRPTPPRASR